MTIKTRALGAIFLSVAVLSLVAFDATAATGSGGNRQRFFVGFVAPAGTEERAAVERHGGRIRYEFAEVAALAIDLPADQVASLARERTVRYIEQDPERHALDLASAQLVPSSGNGLYGLLTTQATTAQQASTGAGVKACLADTALDATHTDIAGNFSSPSIDTVDGTVDLATETHATHVAGTMAGVTNSSGIFGVAYGAQIVHARVLGPNGGSTSGIMAGVDGLIARGCKIINLSLGGGLKSRTEENFYKAKYKNGILVIAAAGNDGSGKLSYPAGYPVVVAVGAVDRNNAHASFSNTGRNIDLSAPGVDVLSSVPVGQGSESSVTSGTTTYTAFGMEFAGQTNGRTGTIVNCGTGNDADPCPETMAGKIALMQRGTETFATKVTNAMNQGAVAAIIYNNVSGDFQGTLGAAGTWIPTVSVSDVTGGALLAQARSSASGTVVNTASNWDTFSGTSMATPHVAGVAALVWSKNAGLKNSDVESILKNSAANLGPIGFDSTYGYGLVNAEAALALTP